MSESVSPLILTLKLDQDSFSYLNQLRQDYFPPEKNYLPAHITLFHALPGDRETIIQQALQAACLHTPVLSLTFSKPRFLGRGVAIEVDCADLIQLRQQLAKTWSSWLSRQDQQGYRPHITIQNKTTSDQARQLYEQLANKWNPLDGYGEGLLLWYYQGGPWELIREFTFK